MTTVHGGNVLRLSEIFGPTFQGEGPSLGQRAAFVRLMLCNLTCTWCDTAYTWDRRRYDLATESLWLPVQDATERLVAMDTPLVVITGGEPLLQAPGVLALARRVADQGRRVEIETNGTIAPPQELLEMAWWNVSPKLAHSGVREAIRIQPKVLGGFAGSGRAVFKFVARTRKDLDEITGLVDAYGLDPGAVWVMPEGISTTTTVGRMRALADEVLARGYSMSPRLHVLLWEDARGR